MNQHRPSHIYHRTCVVACVSAKRYHVCIMYAVYTPSSHTAIHSMPPKMSSNIAKYQITKLYKYLLRKRNYVKLYMLIKELHKY